MFFTMKYTTLGNTGLKVSKICLGTMTWGQQNTEAEGHAQLDFALDQGINFIDTAEMYSVPGRQETQGSTERIIGNWIAARRNRDRFVLATKVTGPSGMTWIRDPLRFDQPSLEAALDGSLQRLRTDYVDLYQLHWPERKTNFFGRRGYEYDPSDSWQDNFLEVLQAMQGFIQAGKIRHFGISNETPWGLMRFIHLSEIHGLPRCVSIQNPYNLLNRTFEVGLAEIAIREQCGLLAYSPMAFGLLSGKYHRGQDSSHSRINLFKQLSRYNSEQSFRATGKYLEIAQDHDMSLAQLSLAYVTSRPFVTSNIIGATSMEQLRENIGSLNIKLSVQVIKEIEEVHRDIPNPAP